MAKSSSVPWKYQYHACLFVALWTVLFAVAQYDRVGRPSRRETSSPEALSKEGLAGQNRFQSFEGSTPSTGDDSASNTEADSVCRVLNGKSALSIWSEFLEQIVTVPQDPTQPSFTHDELINLLKIVSPRLPQSTAAVERDTAIVQRILDKGWLRYRWIVSGNAGKKEEDRRGASNVRGSETPKNGDDEDDPPPPIKIYVVGGSVTEGHHCGEGRYSRDCAWPRRLERLLNQLILGDYYVDSNEDRKLVQVHNAAIESTGTYLSLVLLENELFSVPDYDILINAHSTNDVWVARLVRVDEDEDDEKELSVGEIIFHTTQKFARAALNPFSCRNKHYGSPLLVWYDDYLGNRKPDNLVFPSVLSQQVSLLANYYGFSFWSYPNAVNDFVHRDTRGVLTKQWYDGSDGSFIREVHPLPEMHVVTSFIMAYNFLNLATTHCAMESWHNTLGTPQTGFPAYQDNKTEAPLTRHHALRPKLSTHLLLGDVSDIWQKDQEQAQAAASTTACPPAGTVLCLFSWLGGSPGGSLMQSDTSAPGAATNSSAAKGLGPIIKSAGSWEYTKYEKKHKGWAVTGAPASGSSVTMTDDGKNGNRTQIELENLVLELRVTQSVRALTFFVMQSYGEKFAGSEATATVLTSGGSSSSEESSWQVVATKTLKGYHNQTTSETKPLKMMIPNRNGNGEAAIPVGNMLQIRLALSGGITFKLMGLTICS